LGDDFTITEIHVLTSSIDIVNLFWALNPFIITPKKITLYVFTDDGSLNESSLPFIKISFSLSPNYFKKRGNEEILDTLTQYPECLKFRQNNHLHQDF